MKGLSAHSIRPRYPYLFFEIGLLLQPLEVREHLIIRFDDLAGTRRVVDVAKEFEVLVILGCFNFAFQPEGDRMRAASRSIWCSINQSVFP